jgi:ABC-type nitrate/sulfonate/bicarbonate transport system ATPase subunit
MPGRRGIHREQRVTVSQQSKALIAFEDVSLTLGGRPILTGIDLSIRKGEFLSVVGPSGCGKTSLLNLVAGFLTPSGGRVSYAGKPVTGPRQDIAIVFQDYGKALLPWRTASGNIALALEAMNSARVRRISTGCTRVSTPHCWPPAAQSACSRPIPICMTRPTATAAR